MAETNFGFPLSVGDARDAKYRGGLPGLVTAQNSAYDVVPIALNTTGVAQAQAVAGAANLTLNGALATAGLVTFDVPRAVQIVSSGAGDTTQTALFTGKDVYGVAMTELVAFNGVTPVFGKKAFKTISSVAISAVMAGNASAGSSDILGLPYFSGSRNYLFTAYAGAQVTTGTYVAGVTTSPATNITGDVRGTYLPPSATNGTNRLTAYQWVPNPDTIIGLYGVAQA